MPHSLARFAPSFLYLYILAQNSHILAHALVATDFRLVQNPWVRLMLRCCVTADLPPVFNSGDPVSSSIIRVPG